MGSPQIWTVSFYDTSGVGSGTAEFGNAAGDEIVFGIDGNGVTPEVVASRVIAGEPDTAAGNLEQAALHFWLEHDYFDQMAAAQLGVLTLRMPSVVQMAAPLTVNYLFGLPRSGTYRSRSGDAKQVLVAVAGRDAGVRRQFVMLAGIQGSAIEGSVLDQLLSRPEETSVSTTQYLAIAMRQGLRVYAITAENLHTVLPQITTSAEVKQDIATAVAAGRVAVVPERDLEHNGYTGIGYLLLDPQSGAGAYLIDGGRNGFNMPDCKGAARPQGGQISLQALLAWQTLAPALLGFVETNPTTEAERVAYQIAKEEIEKLVKPVAERIAKRLGARMLVALAVPGANVIVGIALAVEITLELYLVAMKLKVLMETLELQTRKRTAEDLRCRCKDTPTAPECACSKEAYPHRRIRVIPPISLYDVRVDVHHTCADASGNSYGGRDVRMDSPRRGPSPWTCSPSPLCWPVR